VRKKELADEIAHEHGLSAKAANALLDAVFDEILKAALRDDPYHHPSFGTFVITVRKPRRIHNVHSREMITIPSKKILRLLPSRRLNKKINSKAKARHKK